MHRACWLLVLPLAACEREPSFDERYETAQQRIETQAEQLDRDLESSELSSDVEADEPYRPEQETQ